MKYSQVSVMAIGVMAISLLCFGAVLLPDSAIASIPAVQSQEKLDENTVYENAAQGRPEIQPLHTISDAVEAFIYRQAQDAEQLNVTVKQIDSRLRLALCNDSLESTWSPGSRALGRVTVQVACPSPRPWRVHVQATVTMQGTVWTLNRGVRRDEVLDKSLLVQQEMTIGDNSTNFRSLGTPVIDIEPWLGFVFTQRVHAGKVLNEQMLKPAQLIIKGEAVVIQHKARGLEILARGVALHDAGRAEQTRVRNTSSGKIVDVVVVAPGTVETLQ